MTAADRLNIDADVVLDRTGDNHQTTYLNGPGVDDKLRQTNTQTGPLYFLQDQLGSTTAVTDSSGVWWNAFNMNPSAAAPAVQ